MGQRDFAIKWVKKDLKKKQQKNGAGISKETNRVLSIGLAKAYNDRSNNLKNRDVDVSPNTFSEMMKVKTLYYTVWMKCHTSHCGNFSWDICVLKEKNNFSLAVAYLRILVLTTLTYFQSYGRV